MKIIPKLFYQDNDENGQDFLRPATTDDVDAAIALWAIEELKNREVTHEPRQLATQIRGNALQDLHVLRAEGAEGNGAYDAEP